jgi:hypothetical protein
MKENNLYDMIRSAFNTDEEGFKSFFDDEMKDRLAGKFAEKHVEIARDVLTQDEIEADEHQSNDT